jgi:hypothetical protein
MKLTDTQHAILSAAAQRADHLAHPPERLPAGARQKVAQALLKNDLVIALHRPAYDAQAKWTVDGEEMLLKLTDDGLRAIGIDPNAHDAAEAAPMGGEAPAQEDEDALATASAQAAPMAEDEGDEEAEDDRPRHERLGIDDALIYGPPEEWIQPAGDAALLERALAERTPRRVVAAAQAVLAAWDASPARDATDNPIGRAIDGLRAALASKPARAPRDPAAPRKPRAGTKQEQVLAMLRRPEGATVAQIAEATGWAPHTVRGFFAGLKRRQGIEVQVLERVRMVGPSKEGAKGSYTVYHLPA